MSQNKTVTQTRNFFGSWNFRYLLVNNNSKVWEIESDSINFDYMNIHLYSQNNSYIIDGTLIEEAGQFKLGIGNITLEKQRWNDIFVEEAITSYRKNITWTKNLFAGTVYYDLEGDSILNLFKNRDSVLVFLKFHEE